MMGRDWDEVVMVIVIRCLLAILVCAVLREVW
jgi:hypothetical protein